MVKEGQVICYIEQLGGELPIEVWTFNWYNYCVEFNVGSKFSHKEGVFGPIIRPG